MTKEEAIAFAAYQLDHVLLALKETHDCAPRFALEKRRDFLLAAMAALEEADDAAD